MLRNMPSEYFWTSKVLSIMLQLKEWCRACGIKISPPVTIHWYEHFLWNRLINVSYKGESLNRWLTKGTPQGGVLSPIMWNLEFESLLSRFPDDGWVKIIGFADDAALVTSSYDLEFAMGKMQRAVDQCLAWGATHSLHFSPSKCKAVLFSRKHKYQCDTELYTLDTLPKLYIGSHLIDFEKTVRYLGVILHYKLSWAFHVKWKVARAKKLLMLLRAAAGVLWGLNPAMAIWLYRAIIRPMFTFGCLVWVRATYDENLCNLMTKVQRLALTFYPIFADLPPLLA